MTNSVCTLKRFIPLNWLWIKLILTMNTDLFVILVSISFGPLLLGKWNPSCSLIKVWNVSPLKAMLLFSQKIINPSSLNLSLIIAVIYWPLFFILVNHLMGNEEIHIISVFVSYWVKRIHSIHTHGRRFLFWSLVRVWRIKTSGSEYILMVSLSVFFLESKVQSQFYSVYNLMIAFPGIFAPK